MNGVTAIMAADSNNNTSDSLDVLQYLPTLPPAILLKYLKTLPEQFRTIFHGFTPRDRSLTIPVVKTRLIHEISISYDMASDIINLWQKHHLALLLQLHEDTFTPSTERWLSLQKKYGEAVLAVAFILANRQDWQEFAGISTTPALPQLKTGSVPAAKSAASTGTNKSLQLQIDKLQEKLSLTTSQRDQAIHKTSESEAVINKLKADAKLQQTQINEVEKKLARELRRVKKAEEELEKSEKLRRTEKAIANKNIIPVEAPPAPAIDEVTTLLQQAIQLLQGETPARVLHATPTPAVKPARSKTTLTKPAPPPPADVLLPGTRGEQRYKTATLIPALQANNAVILNSLRDGIAMLDGNRTKMQAAIAQLTKVGVPDVLLNAPLRPAVMDGSNVARIDEENKKGKLDYILQAQKSAWREGYFPVIIIIDASLRYHIDSPDKLDEFVDRGIFIMAEAGTSADKMIIEEAKARRAVLLTNDRMTDWPDAAGLEKRHVKIISGVATITDFHSILKNWFR